MDLLIFVDTDDDIRLARRSKIILIQFIEISEKEEEMLLRFLKGI